MKKAFLAIVILLLVVAAALAAPQTQQPSQQPQQPQQPQQQPPAQQQVGPKTVEERNAFIAFRDELDPAKQVELGNEFLKKFPDSALKAFVYAVLSNAYSMQNDFEHTIEFGEKAIQENPNNLLALLVVSSALSTRTGDSDLDREPKLKRAEDYAKHAIQMINALPQPAGMTEPEWTARRRATEASPHASLGLVYLKRRVYNDAIEQLKMATEMNTLLPNAIDFFWLGLAYEMNKNFDLATPAFQHSIELGGVTKERAQAELDRIQKMKTQAPAPPAEKKEPEKKEPEKK